jgi:hypothetical protein
MSATYVTIGNSDDKLPQREWANFYAAVDAVIRAEAVTVHGAWMSNPIDPWQNACWCVEIPTDYLAKVEEELSALAYRYRQESIAIAGAEVQFIEPMGANEFHQRLSAAQQKLHTWLLEQEEKDL